MKLIHVLLALVLVSSSVFSYPFQGSGTKDDPFKINNIFDLQALSYCSIHVGQYYMLMNDIDATETRYWNVGDHDEDSTTPDEPMGFQPMTENNGTFDGNGHIIYNLYINRPKDGVSLIRDCDVYSVVRRVALENCYFVGWYVSSICTNLNEANIEECYSTGTLIAESSASGFCHRNNSGKITNCYTTCNVTVLNAELDIFDIQGFSSSEGRIERCYAAGVLNSSKKASIFGYGERGNSSYWDVETTGVPCDSLKYDARGLSTSEMKKRWTFENSYWDFDNVWCIEEGRSYPRLKVFNRCTGDIYAGVQTGQAEETNSLEVSPNPTAGISEINYTLSESGAVTIAVTNSLGEQVRQVLSGQYQEAGQNRVTFDASDMPSGVYYCTMKAGGFVVTKKVVVAK